MLEKKDLQDIGNLIDEKLQPLQKDVQSLQKDSKSLQKDVKFLSRSVGSLNKDVTKIRKDQNTILAYFDNEYLDLRKRVEKIEQHPHLSSPS